MHNFLNLIDKVDRSETRVILIKLLVMISESVDSKVEFVRREGFTKLLKLLMRNDENVTRVISLALLHFLQIENCGSSCNSSADDLSSKCSQANLSSVQLNEN